MGVYDSGKQTHQQSANIFESGHTNRSHHYRGWSDFGSVPLQSGGAAKRYIFAGGGQNQPIFPTVLRQILSTAAARPVPLTAGEIFEAQNLSDKINGKAELYLSAGFVRLISQRFKDERGSDLWIEAFL